MHAHTHLMAGIIFIIMAGDWNLVLDLHMDYCNYKYVNNPLAGDRVENIIF